MPILKSRLNILLGGLFSLALALLLFGATGRDDNYISFWPAWAWVHIGLPLNYNGEAFEQSSSFLWVALLAGSHWLTSINIPELAYAWGMIGLLMSIWAAHNLGRMMGISAKMLAWLPFLIGTQAYVAYWSLSGMETSLATACMVWSVYGWLKAFKGKWPIWLPIVFIAWVLLRPEAGFVAFLTAILAIFIPRQEPNAKSKIWIALACAAALIMVPILIRLSITGQAFPNPAILKSSLPWWFKLKAGIKYLLYQGLLSDLGLLAILSAAAFLFRKPKLSPAQFLILALLFSLACFVLLSGGDWMEAGRFMLPIAPLVLLLAIALLEKTIPSKRISILGPALLLLNLGFCLKIAAFDSTGSPIWAKNTGTSPEVDARFSAIELKNRGHLADAHATLALHQVLSQIEEQTQSEYRVMSGQAGMIMYYNAQWHPRQVHWVDFYGLSTKHVKDCPIAKEILSSMQPYRWEYGGFFEMMAAIQGECPAFHRPEVVFDLDFARDPQHLAFEQNGYEIVWKQTGILRNPTFPKGADVNGYQFIALSKEFLRSLPKGLQVGEQHIGE